MSLSSSPSPFKLDEVVLLEREHITLSLSPIFFWRRLVSDYPRNLCGRMRPLDSILWWSRNLKKTMMMYQTSLNHTITPKQYDPNRLRVRDYRSRPNRRLYSSTTQRSDDEFNEITSLLGGKEWGEYEVDDLIELVAVIDEEGEDEGEKYYFEIVQKSINDSGVSFIGYIDGLEYQLDISKTVEEARLHTRDGGGGNFSSSVPKELLNFCPEFEILHKDLTTANKYPVFNSSRHKRTIRVDWVKHEKITDLAALKTKASENPDFWSLGTTPSQPPLTAIERLTLNAGEIYALLAGNRPLALIQLYAPFVEDGQAQPIDCPFVKRALKELVTTSPQIFACVACRIEGSTALSAVFYPNISPNRERASLLASFGAQGALVAQSPYYGVLIGECLGYARENIYHHVKNTCNLRGDISKAVLDQVEFDLRECSPVEPLPRWRNGYDDDALKLVANGNSQRRRRKKKRSSSSVEALEAFLGKKK